MDFEEQIRHYADRHNLMDDDVEFILGLLRMAIARERSRAANLAWEMQMRSFGGGTAIGNAIQEGQTPKERTW